MQQRSPLWHLYLSRLREFYRQPARIFWVYVFPTILVIGLGLAFRNQPTQTIAITVVQDGAGESLRSALGGPAGLPAKPGHPGLKVDFLPAKEAFKRLKTGKTPLVVEASPSGGVTYHLDPSRPEAVLARLVTDADLQRARGRTDVVNSNEVQLTEPGTRYVDWLIPGLIGQNTMGGGLWGVGFLLVNFRIAKLLKRFMATPMPRHDFLLAILGARLTFLIPDLGVLLLVGTLLCGMPIRGSLLLVAVIEVVGALAFAGLGLLIASRAKSTETVSGLMNLVMLPMWIFSGLFFSSDRFPSAMQPFIQALPLTQLINALRLVILEGAGLADRGVLIALGILSAWAIGTFYIALRIFRWT